MRRERCLVRVGLALVLIPIFLATELLSGITSANAAPAPQQPAPTPSAAVSGTSPLTVPEDPLGQQSEQQTPETSIQVDVRDGHLVVRVVDVWGPGRVPLVVRSWTGAGDSPAGGGYPPPYSASYPGAGYWQFNQHLMNLA